MRQLLYLLAIILMLLWACFGFRSKPSPSAEVHSPTGQLVDPPIIPAD